MTRLLLTLCHLICVCCIFYISNITYTLELFDLPLVTSNVVLVYMSLTLLTILLFNLSFQLFKFLGVDTMVHSKGDTMIKSIESTDSSYFIPYLIYFTTLIAVHDIITLFYTLVLFSFCIYHYKIHLYNPLLKLFGYSIYKVITINNVKIFVFTKQNLTLYPVTGFDKLYRLEDRIFIEL